MFMHIRAKNLRNMRGFSLAHYDEDLAMDLTAIDAVASKLGGNTVGN